MTTLEMVKEFHGAFDAPIYESPYLEDEIVNDLRVELIREELQELEDALYARDPAETLDALADLQYVLDGAFLSLGFYKLKELAVQEAHRSNMTKLGTDGKPVRRQDGKITKGPNFVPPNFERLLNNANTR